ncbi:MAG TPA: hypothetical protein VEA99_01015, partial [Gemmatimonadaceae bacterium]|nr:hypothetical protein [Gemmatimonadaceae bacterium]
MRWHRDVGAWVEVKGVRVAMPMAQSTQRDVAEDVLDEADDMMPLPYFPGHETLFIGGNAVKAEVNEEDLIHPIAEGAEAYYTYATGDSASIRLPDGRTVRLRELEVRPRVARWNVAVGSLWFDADRGQLVRAAYRLAQPLDVWALVDEEAKRDGDDDDVPGWVKGMMSPFRGQVRAIAVEYGLYGGGRFWLPRLQYAEGDAQVSFMRVPFKMEMSYRYASVNGTDSLPPIVQAGSAIPDSLSGPARDRWRDSARTARRAERDSVAAGTKRRQRDCDASGMRTAIKSSGNDDQRVPIAMRIPCDVEVLARSPDLPASIYDPGEELFGVKEREDLVAQALSLGVQPEWGPTPPRLRSGIDLARYNRVEGLSLGAVAEQDLGRGYSASLLARLGVADLEPNAELTFQRSDLTRTLRLRGYNRLVSAGDWGDPLNFGSSLSALLFGRDEGFYYRASGVELGGTRQRASGAPWIEWRLFAERERAAKQETEWSLSSAMRTPDLPVNAGQFAGGALRVHTSRGLDPRGFRLFTDLRVEGAAADTGRTIGYGRAAFDATVTRGLGPVALALTGMAGSALGELPVQRHWYLGGAYTVRGQRPGAASGDAFWMGRAELGAEHRVARSLLFADIGWAGDRRLWREVGRPLSSVGAGISLVDGLVRFDVARGIWPEEQWRVYSYVEARF